jgi:hypothetical protein
MDSQRKQRHPHKTTAQNGQVWSHARTIASTSNSIKQPNQRQMSQRSHSNSMTLRQPPVKRSSMLISKLLNAVQKVVYNSSTGSVHSADALSSDSIDGRLGETKLELDHLSLPKDPPGNPIKSEPTKMAKPLHNGAWNRLLHFKHDAALDKLILSRIHFEPEVSRAQRQTTNHLSKAIPKNVHDPIESFAILNRKPVSSSNLIDLSDSKLKMSSPSSSSSFKPFIHTSSSSDSTVSVSTLPNSARFSANKNGHRTHKSHLTASGHPMSMHRPQHLIHLDPSKELFDLDGSLSNDVPLSAQELQRRVYWKCYFNTVACF